MEELRRETSRSPARPSQRIIPFSRRYTGQTDNRRKPTRNNGIVSICRSGARLSRSVRLPAHDAEPGELFGRQREIGLDLRRLLVILVRGANVS